MKANEKIHALLIAVAASSAVACGEPMKKAQEIEEPRTLAVQIEGQDGSATPAPGDDATLRVLFAGPSGPQRVNVAYKICESADSARGVPYCVGEVYEEGSQDGVDSLLEVAFSVPESAADETRIAVLGVACETGEPTLAEDPDDFHCSGGETPLAFSFDAYLGGAEENENPDLSGILIEIDGREVTLEGADEPPSCDESVAMVDAEKSLVVTVEYGSDAREEDEWLQVSHFATKGEYERQYTILEPDERLATEIEWESSKAGASKHYVVVRDGLGGVSFVTFSVCAE